MPLRRRAGDADRHTFDLVEDPVGDPSEGLGAVPAPGDGPRVAGPTPSPASGPDPEPDPGADHAHASSRRRRRRRALLAGVAAVALVLGGMAVVDAVASRRDAARLAQAPGGLLPIEAQPQVAWEKDMDPTTDGFAFVPGVLVANEGDDVAGYDLDSGAEAWRHTFDGPTTCGTPAIWYASSAGVTEDDLVCVPGSAADLYDAGAPTTPQTVTVLAGDGSVVGQREVDPGEGPGPTGTDEVRWLHLMPGPDGAVLWVGRVGAPSPEQGKKVELDGETGEIEPIEGEVGDIALAAQDVATGDLRWYVTSTARREVDDPYACVQFTGDSWDDQGPQRGVVDLDQVWVYTDQRVVTTQGCGGAASYTAEGVRIDDPDDVGDVGAVMDGRYVRDPSGGAAALGGTSYYDEDAEPLRAAVLRDDGSVAWTAPGLLFAPTATDGRAGALYGSRDGALVAFDDDGTVRWTAQPPGAASLQVLVATRDRVVVPTAAGGLTALDAATGEERWTLEQADDPHAPTGVTQAFTDGRTALFLTSDGIGTAFVAVDLTDGTVLWTSEQDDDAWGVVAVQGRLVRIAEQSVAVLR